MFNVCPGCGEYSQERIVAESPSRAICSVCSYEHKFLALPLFVITGASGTGKTTAALRLVESTKNFVILDQDILWCDAFNEPADDFRLFRNTWLRMIKNIHQAGKSVVLFGSAIPEQFESCAERRFISRIEYLTLVCKPNELERRLKERPSWRKSGTPENLESMLNFNQWLLENASKTEPRMKVLDTTNVRVEDTVSSIQDWLSASVALT
ncbi:MAG: AAA family ATPase [Candidatus Obscuribacterales bacterium]|nr:AAA family ATPase [Candidatus Obscuribacterales bacterium]